MATKRTLEERLAQLDAQKKTLQARLSRQTRARDTRRKVLLGAFVLNEMQTDPAFQEKVSSKLAGFLSRDADKALFTDFLGDGATNAQTVETDVKT